MGSVLVLSTTGSWGRGSRKQGGRVGMSLDGLSLC